MMNKKAIAAFAAGATLLAGFAMATPAFAGAKGDALADAVQIHEANKTLRESQRAVRTAEISLVKLQSAQAAAKTAYENAKTKFDAAKKAAEAAKKAVEDGLTAYLGKHVNDKDFDKTKATAEYKQSEEYKSLDKANTEAEAKLKDTDAEGKTLEKKAEDLKTALDAADAKVTAQTEAVAAAKAQVEANQRYLNALRGVNPGGETKPDQTKPGETKPDQTKPDQTKPDQTKPVQTADPSKSAASAELMRTQVVLAEADATNKDAQEKFVKAKADFEAAKTQMAALDAQVKSAADREEALRVAGKTDTDAYKAAVIDLKAAQSKANAYRTHEYADAEKNFGEKSGKALLAATAYNTALVNYRAAFNKAVEVEASAVKGFADPNTLNPVSTDFPAASAAAKSEAKKVEAKAQTAAPAAGKAGAAAAAKGELAGMGTKGGNGHGGKAGEQLGNAGVGVALTALAASMLAGMGAAVRKMRH
ncbi:chromosome segregation protein SMC [Chlamydia trachomatis]|nr:chromosome segregation protein SMC [Chlamydia trachomatis]